MCLGSVVKVRSWTRLPGDPRGRRTGCERERTVLMEDGVDGRQCCELVKSV